MILEYIKEYFELKSKAKEDLKSLESDEGQGPSFAGYKYEDPRTGEIFTFKRRGVYKKNGRVLVPVSGNHKDSSCEN